MKIFTYNSKGVIFSHLQILLKFASCVLIIKLGILRFHFLIHSGEDKRLTFQINILRYAAMFARYRRRSQKQTRTRDTSRLLSTKIWYINCTCDHITTGAGYIVVAIFHFYTCILISLWWRALYCDIAIQS